MVMNNLLMNIEIDVEFLIHTKRLSYSWVFLLLWGIRKDVFLTIKKDFFVSCFNIIFWLGINLAKQCGIAEFVNLHIQYSCRKLLWHFSVCAIPNKMYLEKLKSFAKLDKTRKLWYLFLQNVRTVVQRIYFWRREWTLSYIPIQNWIQYNTSWFAKILRLKTFGSS